MSSKAMSLKGRINHYAKQNGIAAQVVLQNFMFERFLERLSRSEEPSPRSSLNGANRKQAHAKWDRGRISGTRNRPRPLKKAVSKSSPVPS